MYGEDISVSHVFFAVVLDEHVPSRGWDRVVTQVISDNGSVKAVGNSDFHPFLMRASCVCFPIIIQRSAV